MAMTYKYIAIEHFAKNTIIDEKTITKDIVWLICALYPEKYKDLPSNYKDDYLLAAESLFKSCGKTYQYLSEENKHKLAFLAFKLCIDNINHIKEISFEDGQKMFDYLIRLRQQKYAPLSKTPQSVQEHIIEALKPESIMYLLQDNGHNSIVEALKKVIQLNANIAHDPQCFRIIKYYPYLCSLFSEQLYNDVQLMKPYLIIHPSLAKYCSNLCDDKEFFKEMLNKTNNKVIILIYYGDKIKSDKELMISLFNKNSNYIYNYEYLSENLRADEIILGCIFNKIKKEEPLANFKKYIIEHMPKKLKEKIDGNGDLQNSPEFENFINVVIDKYLINKTVQEHSNKNNNALKI